MSQNSKAIGKSDDDAKVLIIEALAGDHTYGFDIDSIYYIEAEQQWVVIEFLKCDHQSVRPAKSHPRRYWYNWRKFASLWRLAQRLNAELYLVNYEAEAHATAQGRAAREFAVIRVLEMTPTEAGGITREEIEVLDFAGFSRWFRSINNPARQRA